MPYGGTFQQPLNGALSNTDWDTRASLALHRATPATGS